MRFSVKNRNPLKLRCVLTVIFLLLFFVFSFFILKRLELQFWSRVNSYAVMNAENGINTAVNTVMSENNIEYSDLVKLRTYPDGGISALEIDNITVNLLKSKLATEITKEISSKENGYINIALGAVSGYPIFAGVGPDIKVKILPSANALITFKDELSERGINQVKHAIYLDVTVNMTLSTAILQKTTTFNTIIPIADTIIVGSVPQYYGTAGMSFIGD